MLFQKYQHIERIGTVEVEGLLEGICYIFPKIDGTNSSLFLHEDGTVHGTSRNKDLMEKEDDNFDFREVYIKNNIEKYEAFFKEYPNLRLFGEYMKPHTLRTYRDEIWGKFWVFDVVQEINEEEYKYLTYDEYTPIMEKHGIDYIPVQSIIDNPTIEVLTERELEKNTWMIKDGEGVGEGILIKRYDYHNIYGRVTWGKIVRNEFKEKNKKEFGTKIMQSKSKIEKKIANEYITKGRFDKLIEKILANGDGWRSKLIPQVLGRMYYEIIHDEIYNIIKDNRNPIIDFKRLNYYIVLKTKDFLEEKGLL